MTDSRDHYRLFEFHRIRQILADKAYSAPAKKRCLSISPIPREEAECSLEYLTDLRDLIDTGDIVPLHEFPDIREHLHQVGKIGSILDPDALFDIKAILDEIFGITRFFSKLKSRIPHIHTITDNFSPLHMLRNHFMQVFDDHGTIKDSASPRLTKIRREKDRIEKALQKEIVRLMKRAQDEGLIHEDNPTIRDGRLVLPVRTEFKRKVNGIIHGQSGTGLTTFIEPLEIVEINNALMENSLEEKDEIRRIISLLCDDIRTYQDELHTNFNSLIDLDFYYTCARLSRDMDAVCPQLTGEMHLKITNARNPILSQKNRIVPLSLEIQPGTHVVLITGPNAGGKTVAIKTVALMSAMAQSGLFVPCSLPTIIPTYDEIYVDIGDQQSISDDLSTFSSHLRNIKDILERATSESLVIVDEIGTGTDPFEGASLAQSILEELNRIGAHSFVTTHHSALKAFAHHTEGVVNAALEFDQDDLSPTYWFQLGVPGSSYALEISRRLGLHDRLLRRAKELLGTSKLQLTDLIADLEKTNQSVKEEERELQVHKETLDRLISRYETRLGEIEKDVKAVKREKLRDVDLLLKDANREIERVIRHIREKSASRETIKESKSILSDIHRERDRLAEAVADRPVSHEDLSVGDAVRIRSLSDDGIIVRFNKNGTRAAVEIDDKLVWIDRNDLIKTDKPEKNIPSATVNIQADSPASSRLDLRGFRVDEAKQALDRYLNQCVVSNLRHVEILHGKGTGALQTMVHEELEQSPLVKSYHFAHPDSGGYGITELELH